MYVLRTLLASRAALVEPRRSNVKTNISLSATEGFTIHVSMKDDKEISEEQAEIWQWEIHYAVHGEC